MAAKYIFGGNTGETPESVARKRAIAAALLGGSRPTTFGQGLSALGEGIASRVLEKRATRAEEAGLASVPGFEYDAATGGVVASGGGGGGGVPTSVDQATLAAKIKETADALGADPVDLATIMSYETAGTMDPRQPGPVTKWGQHKGFIQFGEPQAQAAGVDFSTPETALFSQLGKDGAVAKFFLENGYKPGMTLEDMYSIVNAGEPGRYDASDEEAGGAPGTVRQKVSTMAAHRSKALKLLNESGAYNGYVGAGTEPGGAGAPVAAVNPRANIAATLQTMGVVPGGVAPPVDPNAPPAVPGAPVAPSALPGVDPLAFAPTPPPDAAGAAATAMATGTEPPPGEPGVGGAPIVPAGLPTGLTDISGAAAGDAAAAPVAPPPVVSPPGGGAPVAPGGPVPTRVADASGARGLPTMESIMAIINHPWAPEGTKAVAAALLKQRLDMDNPQFDFVETDAGIVRVDPTGRRPAELVYELPADVAAAKNSKYGLTGQVIVDDKGNKRIAQLSEAGGEMKIADMPPGYTLSNKANVIDAGTKFVLTDPYTGAVVAEYKKNSAGETFDEAMGKALAAQATAAPSQIQAADDTIKLLDSIITDPAMDLGVGWSSIMNATAGTPGFDFANKVKQAQAGAFLTAIAQLRGLGALSDAEGQTAKAAINRMEVATSKGAFLEAWADYKRIVVRGRENAMRVLGTTSPGNFPMPAVPPAETTVTPPAPTPTSTTTPPQPPPVVPTQVDPGTPKTEVPGDKLTEKLPTGFLANPALKGLSQEGWRQVWIGLTDAERKDYREGLVD